MVNKTVLIITASTMLCSCLPATRAPLPPLEVVSYVELSHYTGTWYEIARYPNSFQKGCIDSSVAYKLRPDASFTVLNSCLKNGTLKTTTGEARVVDPITNARLKVSSFWSFSGDYWIIDLGADYEYAVVSGPDRKYLWILARSPQMDDALYGQILGRLKDKGFDIQRLEKNAAH
jgi:apolipoprotein D and lipocalin family protein